MRANGEGHTPGEVKADEQFKPWYFFRRNIFLMAQEVSERHGYCPHVLTAKADSQKLSTQQPYGRGGNKKMGHGRRQVI